MLRQDRFVTLDGMRGLAALVVAVSHVAELLGIGVPPNAHLAVDFFFVLSGFVIAHAYEERLASTMRPIDFIRARVVRLHPLIVLGSAIGLMAAIAGSATSGGPGPAALAWMALAGTLMIPVHQQSWPAAFPLDGPAWSLFAEYGVNILFALIAASLTIRRLRLVLGAGLGLLALLALGPAGLESYWRIDLIGLSLLRVVYPFFAGVLVNRLCRAGKAAGVQISPLLSTTLLLAILLAPAMPFNTLFQFAMIAGVFPFLVMASAGDQLADGHSRWMLTGGALSYPLYTLHFPVATLLVPVAASFLSPVVALGAIMLVVIGLSALALRYYDEPARAWLSSRLRLRRAQSLAN